MTRPIATAVALILLAACNGSSVDSGKSATPAEPSEPVAPAEPTPGSPGVTASLRVTDEGGATGPLKLGTFAAFRLEGRCASAQPGRHTVRLEVVSPSGTVYASLPEQLVVTDGGAANVAREVRVRGTNIEALRRVGTWRFTLTLDGGDPLASADVDLTE